jgi:protein-tyrosine phosphatase
LELLRPEDGEDTAPLQRYLDGAEEADPAAPYPGEPAGSPAGTDYSRPKPVMFAWKPVGCGLGRIRYSLHLSRNEDFSEPTVYQGISQPHLAVRNLFVGTRYFWKVRAEGRRIEPVESAVWSFRTHPALPRWVFVPGITNMRDLGGWPTVAGRVRQGLVYRSSAMSSRRMRGETERILLDELTIRTDLDLRSKDERPHPVLDEGRVRWCHAPVLPYGELATAKGMSGYRNALRVFTDPDAYPILCHCRAGADRVGTVVFLLLGLLGVEFDDLARDYELTSFSVWGKRSRHSAAFQTVVDALQTFPGATINEQIRNYAIAIGLTAEEIDRIRGILLEPGS